MTEETDQQFLHRIANQIHPLGMMHPDHVFRDGVRLCTIAARIGELVQENAELRQEVAPYRKYGKQIREHFGLPAPGGALTERQESADE